MNDTILKSTKPIIVSELKTGDQIYFEDKLRTIAMLDKRRPLEVTICYKGGGKETAYARDCRLTPKELG